MLNSIDYVIFIIHIDELMILVSMLIIVIFIFIILCYFDAFINNFICCLNVYLLNSNPVIIMCFFDVNWLIIIQLSVIFVYNVKLFIINFILF